MTVMRSTIGAGVVAFAIVLAGCGSGTEEVCVDKENVALLAATSVSDIEVSQEVTAEVSVQAVERAANGCGVLTVGIFNNTPQADLVVHPEPLVPTIKEAGNRKPVIDKLVDMGTTHVHDKLLAPLAEAQKTKGSPFFGALVKLGHELELHDSLPATIVLVGDLVEIERAPDGRMVDFRHPEVAQTRVDVFVPDLKTLKGSCVIVVAAGAASDLPEETIAAGQELFGATLRKAGVGFAATRSPTLPPGCRDAPDAIRAR
jgi:hypothetical protein